MLTRTFASCFCLRIIKENDRNEHACEAGQEAGVRLRWSISPRKSLLLYSVKRMTEMIAAYPTVLRSACLTLFQKTAAERVNAMTNRSAIKLNSLMSPRPIFVRRQEVPQNIVIHQKREISLQTGFSYNYPLEYGLLPPRLTNSHWGSTFFLILIRSFSRIFLSSSDMPSNATLSE